MRRWQVTAVLVMLAGLGTSLAMGLPIGILALRSMTPAPAPAPQVVPAVVVAPAVAPAVMVDELTTHPNPNPVRIPERTAPRPLPARIELPPDPVLVHAGCGGGMVPAGDPVPECGMG